MAVLSTGLRKQLENGVLSARRTAEVGARAVVESLGVFSDRRPDHVSGEAATLRNGLRAKWRQLGLDADLLIGECAFEQWHRLLFARFLAENGLLLHPDLEISVTLDECEELAGGLGEPDGWSVAGRFAAQILPGTFRLDDPCVKIRLAPEHRVALEQILASLPIEVFTADDSLGWVYQYWQKDSKDEVNASERKVGGADIGPVTQLFTENYMVRFLLENSLGAWWAGRHPTSPLIKSWEYLRFDDDGFPAAGTFAGWPVSVAEVTVMDPCCGSGHFLVDAFGMLWRMRAEEEGLSALQAQDAVLRDNLYGLELDARCVQIAMFAIAFQAWKDGGGWRPLPVPNIACSGIPVKTPLDEWTALARGDERLANALIRLHELFRDADTLGSLIDPQRVTRPSDQPGLQPSFYDVEWEEIAPLLTSALGRETDESATAVLGTDALGIASAALLLSKRYVLVATNVPYLLRRRHSPALASFADAHYPRGRSDLATIFIERLAALATAEGCTSMVLPNGWTSSRSYEDLRRWVLSRTTVPLALRLGSGAFEAISGEVVNVILWVGIAKPPTADARIVFIDASRGRTVAEKLRLVRNAEIERPLQSDLLASPSARIARTPLSAADLLAARCHAFKGMTTGDDPRWKRWFWELGQTGRWHRMQTASSEGGDFTGCHYLVDFDRMTDPMSPGVELRGEATWGHPGVAVSQMSLCSSLSAGVKFDQNVAILIPNVAEDLPAVAAFCRSDEYVAAVRDVDQGLKVTNATLTQVPFDVTYWRAVAAERYPDGLPEPWSDDPTQWLFEGRPEVSTSPLQVAVGRLLGFRWPEQPEQDDLDRFVDTDGIVCLPSVAGEAPAAEQLTDLLAAAFGTSWDAGKLSQLLADTGSRTKTLADWLRNEFFKHHCAVFGNRPFVWHVWDGHPQGFSALVNYHRLDQKTLQKLTYTYLGKDWIERQRAAVRDDEAGAEARLTAAEALKKKLELILKGEAPYDIYVRWKSLKEQPTGWEPDLNDGVRLNIRPFVEAGVLRSPFNIHWKKDRGTNPDGSERLNDVHLTHADKQQAREKH